MNVSRGRRFVWPRSVRGLSDSAGSGVRRQPRHSLIGGRPTLRLPARLAVAAGIVGLLGALLPTPGAIATDPPAAGVTTPAQPPAPAPAGYAVGATAAVTFTGNTASPEFPGAGRVPMRTVQSAGSFNGADQGSTGEVGASIPRIVADAAAAGTTWTTTKLASSYEAAGPSLKIDGNGKVHVAYIRTRTGAGISYATNSSGSWVTEQVWTGAVTRYPSLVLDVSGAAHIAFATDNEVFYATNRTGTWVTTQVMSDVFGIADNPTVAADANSKAHLIVNRMTNTGNELIYATNKSGSWVETLLTTSPDFSPSLALDAAGKVHVAFWRSGGASGVYSLGIYYATNVSGSWFVTPVTTVDPTVDSIWNPSLALDATDKAHIAFSRSTIASASDDGINYATNASGSWVTTQVSTDRYDQGASLALDGSGKVHIAFYRGWPLGGPILHATNSSGSWVESLVTSDQDLDHRPSLGLDGNGKAHVAYDRMTVGFVQAGIEYATNTSGSWVGTSIAGISLAGDPAIALDGNGKAHIAYGRGDVGMDGGVYYATNASGTWITELVTAGVADAHVSLALDGNGKAHIVFSDGYVRGQIKYATNASGTWVTTSITTSADREPSLAIDGDGKAHVVFSRQGLGLFHATNRTGSWVTAQISTGTEDREPSVALDATGNVHVAFWRGPLDTGSGIWYATNQTGSWIVSPVATSADDTWPSLALDANGKAHIAYLNFSLGVYYATNASGSWVTTLITTDGTTPALALDAQGKAHVAYPFVAGGFPTGADPSGMFHATNASGIWVSDRVTTFRAEYYGGVAVDARGTVHLTWVNDVGVMYANNLDITAPSVSALAPTTASPTSGTTITYSLTFSEPVTGLVAADFAIGGTSSGWTVGSVTGSGTGPYAVTLTATAPTSGTVLLTLAANTVVDLSGNAGPTTDVSAASVTVTPATVPSAPASVIATPGDAQAAVAWSAPASDGGSPITGYTVTSSPDLKTCTTTGVPSCTVTGLANGTPYTFTVTATNAVGTGPASPASAPVTPTAPIPVPPTAAITALPVWRVATSIPLHWSATPGTAPVASYDVRYRRATWKGSFGSSVLWRSATAATGATFGGAAGSTYCFSVRARDTGGLVSAWTAMTCTGVPLDDRSLSRSSGWTAGTGSAYYKHTYLRATRYGAKLVRTGVVARRIAIVATTCPTCGKVRVYWGSTLLRTISLYSATTINRKLITVKTFTSARTGTLTLRVASSGKKVVIDGLAIRRN